MRRFWDKVRVTGLQSCWEWGAVKNQDGYGRFRLKGRLVSAHRFSYELVRGQIPEGLELDHLCSNRGCVHPFHLEAVTHAENVRRGALVSARCKRGHLRQPDDRELNGACKTCIRGARSTEEYRTRAAARQRAYRKTDKYKTYRSSKIREKMS